MFHARVRRSSKQCFALSTAPNCSDHLAEIGKTCSALDYSVSGGAIVIARGGGCGLVAKALNAQAAGTCKHGRDSLCRRAPMSPCYSSLKAYVAICPNAERGIRWAGISKHSIIKLTSFAFCFF